jgi:hypothetical protein
MYNIQDLEWKEKQCKDKCRKLSKRISKYKDVVPLTEDIAALGIGLDELLAFKMGINQAAKCYNLPFASATMRLIEDIKAYNKINDLKKELSSLYMQKYTVDQVCSSQNKSMRALMNLQSWGITEAQIISLSNILARNQSSL